MVPAWDWGHWVVTFRYNTITVPFFWMGCKVVWANCHENSRIILVYLYLVWYFFSNSPCHFIPQVLGEYTVTGSNWRLSSVYRLIFTSTCRLIRCIIQHTNNNNDSYINKKRNSLIANYRNVLWNAHHR